MACISIYSPHLPNFDSYSFITEVIVISPPFHLYLVTILYIRTTETNTGVLCLNAQAVEYEHSKNPWLMPIGMGALI